MKIAIVTGHFMPEIGYQEVYLARALSRLGHEVTVLTSTAISPTGKRVLLENYQPGVFKDEVYGYTIIRISHFFKVGAKVIAFGLTKWIKKIQPDLIISLAVAKLFPLPVFIKKYPCKKIVLFGDAEEYIKDQSKAFSLRYIFYKVTFKLIKSFAYRVVVRNANRIIFNIPEAERYFYHVVPQSYHSKIDKMKLLLHLGYDPDEFYFNEEERIKIREKHAVADDEIVIITSTRVNKRKNLEKIIDAVDSLISEGSRLKYIIIGFHEDDYGNELKQYTSSKKNSSSFITLPFLDHNTIRKYYNAADIGIWIKAAISIQEAMGTGLFILLPKKESVSHLLTENITGNYYDNQKKIGIELKFSLEKFKETFRETRANHNKRFSYNHIVKEIINYE